MTNLQNLTDLAEPRLVIHKAERRIELFDGDVLIRTYKMALGFAPSGNKELEGDGRTPEGDFYVFAKNPKSKFHLSLGLSYPGLSEAERGLNDGLISQEEHDEIVAATAEKRMPLQKTKLGGDIYIHGGGTASDWTEGCVALENGEMAELFDAIPVGTKVSIHP